MDECQARAARARDELQGATRQKSSNRELQDHVDTHNYFAHVHLPYAAAHDNVLSAAQRPDQNEELVEGSVEHHVRLK